MRYTGLFVPGVTRLIYFLVKPEKIHDCTSIDILVVETDYPEIKKQNAFVILTYSLENMPRNKLSRSDYIQQVNQYKRGGQEDVPVANRKAGNVDIVLLKSTSRYRRLTAGQISLKYAPGNTTDINNLGTGFASLVLLKNKNGR